jgi:agmatinase
MFRRVTVYRSATPDGFSSTFREGLPGYAGAHATFAYTPLVLDADGLAGADVAILGAPFDEGTTGRPGARFGPRAIRQADDQWSQAGRRHLILDVDPFEELRVVDHGDAAPEPGCHRGSLDNLRAAISSALGHRVMPVVLGGDHSVAHAMLEALADAYGPDGFGVVRFDTHSDVEDGVEGFHHGNAFARAVRTGALRPDRSSVLGLRGYWPGAVEETAAWRARGMQLITMDDVRGRGLDACLDEVLALARGRGGPVYLSVDVDVLEPALAPGTGTPEPGGLSPYELIGAVRRVALELPVCAMDVVEVSPPFDHAEVTALTAHRVVLEALSATAVRRREGA